ncbi:MAG: MFS transporter [Thermomicrobiales bacterium]|nr:MFS transporter [Thermomicrobiales bacterium]
MIDRRRLSFHYGWVVVGVAMISSLLVFGIRSAPSVFVKPLEREFGWSRSEISLAIAVGLLCTGIAAPFGGALMDRIGPRRVLAGSLSLIAVSILLSVWMTEFWQFLLLWGVLSGLGTGAANGLGATISNRWFIERRGLVQGLFGAGTSAGMLLFIPLISWVVVHHGWRSATVMAAAAAMALAPLGLLFVRDRPADVGLLPYGATASSPPIPSRPAAVREVMARAIRTPEFWLLSGSFFICGASSNGIIGTHFIPHAVDLGHSEVAAAGVLAFMGSMNFVGTLASGWLSDKHDPRKLLAMYYILRGMSLFILPWVTGLEGLTVFAIIFGLDYIATVPPTVALTADVFGRQNVGMVYGWVFCAHQIGAALAAQAGGLVYDRFGDYTIAFVMAGGLAVMGGLMALRIDRTPLPDLVQPATSGAD